jgi:hypothetical protein
MAFIHWQDKAWRVETRRPEPASDMERILCVAALCALAMLPLAICAAITIWGA